MFTVTKLARSCGLSRSTVLYYESIGLLRPAARSQGNYRCYAASEQERLRQICVYRNAGLALADIRALLDRTGGEPAAILKRRLEELGREIDRLRSHQMVIFQLLRQSAPSKRRTKKMTKDKWVEIMRNAGFSQDEMQRWHVEFEKSAPSDHQEFLQYLQIPQDEIAKIREWSRKSGK